MRLFKKNEPETVKQEKPQNLGQEISMAGSSYFDKWTMRPYNPAELFQKKGNYDLYDDIREDDQVKAVLMLKKIMILNSDWDIDCDDENIKDFLKECLTEHLDGLFSKKLLEVLTSFDYGLSITEKVFDYSDTMSAGKKIVLSKLKTRPPHTFEIHTDDFGNISKLIQYRDGGGNIELDPSKFIIYANNKEFDNPYGNSEINKGVYRAWWSKNAIIKFWNIFLERFGMPTHVMKIPNTASPGDKATAKKMIQNIQAKTGFTLPEGFELELLEVAGSSVSEYEKAINKYDTMIARSCLVPDLIGLSGSETSGGSYALGKEQFGIFYTTIAFERNNLERLVNKEIISPLVLWNFGSKAQAKFRFNTIDEERKKQDMQMFLEAVKGGKIPINGEQINWFLENINAPMFDDEELEKIESDKQALRDQLTQNVGGEEQKPGEEKQPGDDKKPEQEKKPDAIPPKDDDKKKSDADDEKKFASYFRALTPYEKKVDFTLIENDQNTLLDEYLPQFGKLYKQIVNALVDDVRRRKIIENKRLEQINKLQPKYIVRLTQLYKYLMQDAIEKGRASVEGAKEFNILDAVTGLDDEDIIAWINQYADYLGGVEAQEIMKRIRGVLVDGIRSGAGIRDIVAMISTKFTDMDIVSVTQTSRIEQIVRTTINKAYNEVRASEYKSMASEIQAYQFSAIIDSRTSDICAELDGKIFPPADLDYYNPPLHPNCRSLIVPIFIDEEMPEKGDDLYDVPATDQIDGGFLTLK
jgi:SPP1 gp7 family putative phage head morphogenesis protein